MKRYLLVFILLVSLSVFAQENKNIFGVVEVKHTSEILCKQRDVKNLELNTIVRYMVSKRFGLMQTNRISDSCNMYAGGIVFMPANYFRIDVIGGVSLHQKIGKKESVLGVRLWFGNYLQDFYFNIDGGTAPLNVQAIYFIKPAEWLGIGGQYEKNLYSSGVGPRIELTPINQLKVYGVLYGWWENKNTNDDGYKPKEIFGSVGVKLIF